MYTTYDIKEEQGEKGIILINGPFNGKYVHFLENMPIKNYIYPVIWNKDGNHYIYTYELLDNKKEYKLKIYEPNLNKGQKKKGGL